MLDLVWQSNKLLRYIDILNGIYICEALKKSTDDYRY